jgi:hypothetical protein
MRIPLPAIRRPLFATRITLILATGLGAACESSDQILLGPPSPVISPSQYRLPVGETLRIRATYNGRPCDCVWTTSDESRAVVAPSGLVSGLAPGSITVIATYRRDTGARTSALVEVVAP